MLYEVLVFVQPGCPACEEIHRIAEQIAAHYSTCVVTRFVNVQEQGLLADTMQIQETPTVVGAVNYYPTIRMIGANDAVNRLTGLYTQLLGDHPACSVGSWKGDV